MKKTIIILITVLIPILSYAQEDFGKTEQQLKTKLSNDPDCTFIAERNISADTVMLEYSFVDNNSKCIKSYYLNKDDQVYKVIEIWPLDQLDNVLLAFNSNINYKKRGDLWWQNTSNKANVYIVMRPNYFMINYQSPEKSQIIQKKKKKHNA